MITYPAGYYTKKKNIFSKKLTNRCNTTENFICSLKYGQRKVDLNTSKKSLAFVTIWHFHLYVQLSYAKISYLRKNTHLRKDAAFLHFCLKESLENIFPWNGNIWKQTKIWSNIKIKWETVFISSEGLSDIIAIHPTIFAGRNQKH